MQRRLFLEAGAAAALLPAAAAAQATPPATQPDALEAMLTPFLARGNLPALAAAVVQGGRIVAAGAVGTRRAGAQIPVTREDRFHIGSDTKAMTATLAATEVEAGRLAWTTTVGATFPELRDMSAGLKSVTLEQLLSHTSGLPPDDQAWFDLVMGAYTASDENLNLDEMRLWLLGRFAPRAPVATPGTAWAYANMNYIIAGAMIERVTRRTWEELVAERIFAPLGLTTAGFGPQARRGFVDAPLAHEIRPDGSLKPMLAGPNGDVPAIVGPAGVVHLSILDFATWAGWNAGQGRRGPPIVRPETLRLIHSPRARIPPSSSPKPGTPDHGGSYCLGWGILDTPFSTEPVITHTGSNTMNLAMVFLQPAHDFGMVIATNVGGEKADETLRAAAAEMYGRYGPAKR